MLFSCQCLPLGLVFQVFRITQQVSLDNFELTYLDVSLERAMQSSDPNKKISYTTSKTGTTKYVMVILKETLNFLLFATPYFQLFYTYRNLYLESRGRLNVHTLRSPTKLNGYSPKIANDIYLKCFHVFYVTNKYKKSLQIYNLRSSGYQYRT